MLCVFALSGDNYIMVDNFWRIILQLHQATFLWSIGTSGASLTVVDFPESGHKQAKKKRPDWKTTSTKYNISRVPQYHYPRERYYVGAVVYHPVLLANQMISGKYPRYVYTRKE